MAFGYNHIAYAALDACNAVDIDVVAELAERTGLPRGARVLDIGSGNGATAARLAREFGFAVTAVEGDPVMAELARGRVAGSGAELVVARSGDVLAQTPPYDLIVCLGAIEPAGQGLREPVDMFAALREHMVPGGFLLWGDVVWKGEPPAPLVQMTGLTNIYADDAGWRSAAASAGLSVIAARLSTDAEWDAYRGRMTAAVDAWLAARPDAPEAAGIRQTAARVEALFQFGRPFMDFGLYLLRRPSDG